MENKWISPLAAFVLAFAFAVAGWGNPAFGGEYKAHELRASKMIGKDVLDQTGRHLGEIEDLLMDPRDPGRIAFVVIEPSGSLDFGGDRLVAIPYPALANRGDDLVLNMSGDRLSRAPSFDEDHWPSMSDRAWMAEVYRYFGLSPYWSPVQ